ncbi:uncharacterized protein LOC129266817 [Lytechinus pictus]|uniref:uncharacterized protein LOC129266817 n=1 Tax=Lytechinus pictus TaxID=7653 RepID=UPI0030BA14BD
MMLPTPLAVLVMILSVSYRGEAITCYRCLNLASGDDVLQTGQASCEGGSYGEEVDCPIGPYFPSFDLGCTFHDVTIRFILNGEEHNASYLSRDCAIVPSSDGCYTIDETLEPIVEVDLIFLENNHSYCYCNHNLCNGDYDVSNAPNLDPDDMTGPNGPNINPTRLPPVSPTGSAVATSASKTLLLSSIVAIVFDQL